MKILNIFNFLISILENKIRFFSVYLYYKLSLKNNILIKNKNICIVCDNRNNNHTFGDFLYFAYLARYFVLKNIEIKFFFLEEENNEWKKYLTNKEIKKFKKEQLDLVNKIGKIKKKNIIFTSYENFLKNESNKKKIIFRKQIFSNTKIFDRLLDLLNIIIDMEDKKFLNSFLLNKKEFKKPKKITKMKSYITWHIRFNKRWGNYTNSEDDLNFIYKKLQFKFKNKKILVISDKEGCNFAKNIFKNYKNVFYCKDMTNNFFEDIILLLNSDFYFQYKAGGFLNVASFSSVPYKVITWRSPFNEPWSKKKFVSWQLKSQLREYKIISLSKI